MALALANASALKPDIKLEQALDDYRKVLSDKEREQLDKEKEQLRAQGKPYTEAALNFTTLIDRECNSHRRRSYTRLWQPAFNQEFGPFEKEITQCCQEIKDEAALASKQAQKQESDLQAKERAEAGDHRRFLVQWRESSDKNNTEGKEWRLKTHRRRLRKMKLQALDALSTYDYQKSYKQTRKEWIPGTSEWILENPKFKNWKEGNPRGLWCSGKESMSSRDVTSFFFCRFDDQESLKARTIVGSLARQLVKDLPEDEFRGFSRETPIVEFLENTLSKTRQYFIILDGLDECNQAQVLETCGLLDSLLNLPQLHIKIFWCSRPNVVNGPLLNLPSQQHISLESVESQGQIASDIGRLIEVTLDESLDGDSPQLQLGDPTLILTIFQHLENEAHGIEKRSDEHIIDALSHLPRDLPQTFERILTQFTEPEDVDVGSQIFRWVAVVKRPLTIQELREAIGIVPLQDAWNPRSFINDMKKAIACCGNLLFIDEEQQTIHFTHSSVLQYLCSKVINKSLSRYFIDLEQADADAGFTCVTYLNLPVFNKQMVRTPQNSFNPTAIPSAIVKNSLPGGISRNRLALRLLRRQDKSSKSVQRWLQEVAGDDELSRRSAMVEQYMFFRYAQKFWLEHTKHIIPKSVKLRRLMCNLLEDSRWRNTLSGTPWTYEDWGKHSTNVIEWIVENNHCSLAQLLIDSERESTQETLRMLMKGAAGRGYAELVEICLGSENVSQIILGSSLELAAEGGHLALVERLLQEKANVNATEPAGWTALHLAAKRGHLGVVERLLQEKADVNATSSAGWTALHLAAEGGHLAVIERLLQEKADVNATSSTHGTALHRAVDGGHLDVVERLLQEEIVDVNATDRFGKTALHWAAGHGYLDVVERLLLEDKININATNAGESTALHYAAEKGRLEVVERLLQEEKVDVNATNSVGKTALYLAESNAYLEVVETLLQEENIDVAWFFDG
ncbi:MAG: hypothetical protein L6R40_002064 [Gallowayella cf. fulva]|nr:MAG: hypothetical protein L6R40_002064 [Xanthomendoza cf. fulva]